MKNRILMFSIIFCMMLSFLNVPASAKIIKSGICGFAFDEDNVKWTLDDKGTLTISGSGMMNSYDDYEIDCYLGYEVGLGMEHYNRIPPWFNYMSSIKSVIIEDGVRTIGNAAFYRCSNLTSLTIPASITEIEYMSFGRCDKLTALYITDLEAWCKMRYNCFYTIDNYYKRYDLYLNGTLVTNLIIPDSVTVIQENSFYGCRSITQVTIPDSVETIGLSAFYDCDNIVDVYYRGTAEEWDEISIKDGNNCVKDADIIFDYGKYPIIGKLLSCIYDEEDVTATVELKEINKNCLAMLGVYDNMGKLVALINEEAKVGDSEISLSVPVDGNFAGYRASVFFWDSFSRLEPVGKTISKNL